MKINDKNFTIDNLRRPWQKKATGTNRNFTFDSLNFRFPSNNVHDLYCSWFENRDSTVLKMFGV